MIRFAMFFFEVFFILNVLTVILKISFGDLCVCLFFF